MWLQKAQAFAASYKELFAVTFGCVATAALPVGAYVSLRSKLSELGVEIRGLSSNLGGKIEALSTSIQSNQARADQERRDVRGEIAAVRSENRDDNREMRSYLRSSPNPKR